MEGSQRQFPLQFSFTVNAKAHRRICMLPIAYNHLVSLYPPQRRRCSSCNLQDALRHGRTTPTAEHFGSTIAENSIMQRYGSVSHIGTAVYGMRYTANTFLCVSLRRASSSICHAGVLADQPFLTPKATEDKPHRARHGRMRARYASALSSASLSSMLKRHSERLSAKL